MHQLMLSWYEIILHTFKVFLLLSHKDRNSMNISPYFDYGIRVCPYSVPFLKGYLQYLQAHKEELCVCFSLFILCIQH